MAESAKINTLVFATILGGQISLLTQALREGGYGFTEVDSRLSFIEQPVTSLLIGIPRDRLEALLAEVRQHCPARLQYIPARLDSAFNLQPLMVEALLGGATLFAFEVEQFIQL